jgi:hypothetical protein
LKPRASALNREHFAELRAQLKSRGVETYDTN